MAGSRPHGSALEWHHLPPSFAFDVLARRQVVGPLGVERRQQTLRPEGHGNAMAHGGHVGQAAYGSWSVATAGLVRACHRRAATYPAGAAAVAARCVR
jgi:hypothetical protein